MSDIQNQPRATEIYSGELIGKASATQMSNVPAVLVCLKAASTNTGNFYIGGSGVTIADGTADATTGFPLAAGDQTPWLPIANLNTFYYISDNTTDSLIYTVLR